MENLIASGFFRSTLIGKETVFILKTPCRFIVRDNIVAELKANYLPHEEIGGLLWAKPKQSNEEQIYEIERVSYLRNTIEDTRRTDGLNKSNAYLHDRNEIDHELSSIFTAGYLPIKFHTHPTKSSNNFGSLYEQLHQAETSQQDRRESKIPFTHKGDKILTPRALIIGNELKSSDIIIALYDGEIAPVEVKGSIEKVQRKNMELVSDSLRNVQFSQLESIILIVAAIVIVLLIIKYPKGGLALLVAAAAPTSLLLAKTNHLEAAECYAKLNEGEAKILIP
jgi:hypothetical protein